AAGTRGGTPLHNRTPLTVTTIAAAANRVSAIGLEMRMVGSPPEICNDWRRFCSRIGPTTMVSTSGASGMSSLRRKKPSTPDAIVIHSDITLLVMEYEPTMVRIAMMGASSEYRMRSIWIHTEMNGTLRISSRMLPTNMLAITAHTTSG